MELQELIYTHKCKNGTVATIKFELDSENYETYHFVECNYVTGSGSASHYSVSDWEDLVELGKLINEKVQKLELPPVVFAA